MNVLTTKEIEFTCLQSNCNNTYLVKFLRPIPQIRQFTMYYLLFFKKNQNVYRQIDTQDLILLLLIYIVQVQIHSHFVS